METKYIFVTGGVASSLGKGIISSSIAKLLQARGYNVTIQKFDPYININAGLLNANEHGECYVTTDGHEADLDLGHYERFLGVEMTKQNNITTGRIYQSVINKERREEYRGKTVQVVPHITNEIKMNMTALGNKFHYDFVVTEIGGTVGDIESLPYIECVRQLKWELGKNALSVHLTYVPYLAAAGEMKTKPTQHSVQKLQSLGVQPDILVLRAEQDVDDDMRRKVALFCNVDADAVIQSIDVPTIYQVPINLLNQNMDKIILRKMGLPVDDKEPALDDWRAFLKRRQEAKAVVKIALVGKYELQDAYKSIMESLSQAATYNDSKLKLEFVYSENLNAENTADILSKYQGILLGPGFGQHGVDGIYLAAKYARENDVPTLGIQLGMQCMAVEFARNVIGYADANVKEHNPETQHNVIDLMEENKVMTSMDGTMRLGSFECVLRKGSRTEKIFGKETVSGRHRHRYELNNAFVKDFEKAGMQCVGVNPETHLVEIVEIPGLRWYIGVQFHPEYESSVLNPHPLFLSFIKESLSSK
ncbi:MAG: CTP synthase [Bacteroidaceae bacterium]|nr:CTP synthase [Bacteroidaceae bacterium]